jgi:hypothetical protein
LCTNTCSVLNGIKKLQKKKSRVGVHRTHCCIDHGCKYGYDDCPVASGYVVQDYPCEECPPGRNFDEVPKPSMVLDKKLLTKEKVEKIAEYITSTDGLFCVIDNTATQDREDGSWVMTVPLGLTKDSETQLGFGDFNIKIHSDGSVFYENWSGCKFRFNEPLAVYKILLTAVKE